MPSPPAKWYVLRDGSAVGPLSSKQVRAQAARGQILPSTRLRRDDVEGDFPAEKVKGLEFKQTGEEGRDSRTYFRRIGRTVTREIWGLASKTYRDVLLCKHRLFDVPIAERRLGLAVYANPPASNELQRSCDAIRATFAKPPEGQPRSIARNLLQRGRQLLKRAYRQWLYMRLGKLALPTAGSGDPEVDKAMGSLSRTLDYREQVRARNRDTPKAQRRRWSVLQFAAVAALLVFCLRPSPGTIEPTASPNSAAAASQQLSSDLEAARPAEHTAVDAEEFRLAGFPTNVSVQNSMLMNWNLNRRLEGDYVLYGEGPVRKPIPKDRVRVRSAGKGAFSHLVFETTIDGVKSEMNAQVLPQGAGWCVVETTLFRGSNAANSPFVSGPTSASDRFQHQVARIIEQDGMLGIVIYDVAPEWGIDAAAAVGLSPLLGQDRYGNESAYLPLRGSQLRELLPRLVEERAASIHSEWRMLWIKIPEVEAPVADRRSSAPVAQPSHSKADSAIGLIVAAAELANAFRYEPETKVTGNRQCSHCRGSGQIYEKYRETCVVCYGTNSNGGSTCTFCDNNTFLSSHAGTVERQRWTECPKCRGTGSSSR